MRLLIKLVKFLKSLLKKDKVKMIEAPKQDMSQSDSNSDNGNVTQAQESNEHHTNFFEARGNKKNEFIDSLKVNVKDINHEEECIIETPICIGDGLGIQTDVSA